MRPHRHPHCDTEVKVAVAPLQVTLADGVVAHWYWRLHVVPPAVVKVEQVLRQTPPMATASHLSPRAWQSDSQLCRVLDVHCAAHADCTETAT